MNKVLTHASLFNSCNLGDIYLLRNGLKCIFDYDNGLEFGISQSDRKRWGNHYLMGVTEWLRINKAVWLGNSPELLKAFDKWDITEEEWQALNDFGTDKEENKISEAVDKE